MDENTADPLLEAMRGANALSQILSNSVLPCTPAQAQGHMSAVMRYLNMQVAIANQEEDRGRPDEKL